MNAENENARASQSLPPQKVASYSDLSGALPEKSDNFPQTFPKKFVILSERGLWFIPLIPSFNIFYLRESTCSGRCPWNRGLEESKDPSMHESCYILLPTTSELFDLSASEFIEGDTEEIVSYVDQRGWGKAGQSTRGLPCLRANQRAGQENIIKTALCRKQPLMGICAVLLYLCLSLWLASGRWKYIVRIAVEYFSPAFRLNVSQTSGYAVCIVDLLASGYAVSRNLIYF